MEAGKGGCEGGRQGGDAEREGGCEGEREYEFHGIKAYYIYSFQKMFLPKMKKNEGTQFRFK